MINACDSAAASKGINANLGRIFIRTGIPNVVAMSHKFSSDASALFQTSFYNAFLSETRPFSEAVAIARLDLRENMIRRGGDTGGTKVQDWFVPVVYTNGREVQVTVTGNSGPRLSWPSQLSGQKTKGKSITSIREASIIRHQCAALIGDELNLLPLDTDILKLENHLIEDRVVVLYGSADSLHSIKLRRLARLWLSTNFVKEVQYVDARQFLEESPRLSERLKPQRLVQSPKVDEFYPLAEPIHSDTRASRPSVVLIIDRMDELFSPARPDERYKQGQQKLIDLLDRLPKKVRGYYPNQMPYLYWQAQGIQSGGTGNSTTLRWTGPSANATKGHHTTGWSDQLSHSPTKDPSSVAWLTYSVAAPTLKAFLKSFSITSIHSQAQSLGLSSVQAAFRNSDLHHRIDDGMIDVYWTLA